MSKLNIDQQTIKKLFANKRSDFLIPDYQRPYAWGEVECQTLWDDIFAFAFPENDYSRFKSDEDEYFLGPIVTFKNDYNKLEIIDGQQRLTTLMLLLRAFFSKFGNMKDTNAISTSEDIAKCIWKTDEFGNPDKNKLKIDSEVSTDDDKEEFLSILNTEVCTVAGLPFTRFGQEKAEFKDYLHPGNREFQYNGKEYHIKCSDVFLYPQCYAAVAGRLGKLPAELLIVDIGSKTVDIIHTRKHIPVESDCITIPSALIQCMANINNVVYRKTNRTLTEEQIQQVMMYGNGHIQIRWCRLSERNWRYLQRELKQP